MMKRFIALALSLIMILGVTAVFADEAEKTEMGVLDVNGTFTIRSRIPEGYTFVTVTNTSLNIVGLLAAGEDMPFVTVSIAYNEEYKDTERFNDVDEAVVEEIRESFLELDEEVTFEDLETAYGTRLLKVTGDGFVDIYTIYKGYELEFVMTGANLTEASVQMLVDFISDMDFVAAE